MRSFQKKTSKLDVAIMMGVGLVIVGLLGAMVLEYDRSPHSGVQHVFCINNLRQIDAAANQFALEHNLTNGSTINFPSDLTPYIKLTRDGKIPACPQGGTYQISKVGEKPTCSLGTNGTHAHVLQ
jgi:hypothetical protein